MGSNNKLADDPQSKTFTDLRHDGRNAKIRASYFLKGGIKLCPNKNLKRLLSRWWQKEKVFSRPTRVWVRSKGVSTVSRSNPMITIVAPTVICFLQPRASMRPSAV